MKARTKKAGAVQQRGGGEIVAIVVTKLCDLVGGLVIEGLKGNLKMYPVLETIKRLWG